MGLLDGEEEAKEPEGGELEGAIRNNAPKTFIILLEDRINKGIWSQEDLRQILRMVAKCAAQPFWDMLADRNLLPSADAMYPGRLWQGTSGATYLDVLLYDAVSTRSLYSLADVVQRESFVSMLVGRGAGTGPKFVLRTSALTEACPWAGAHVVDALMKPQNMEEMVEPFYSARTYCLKREKWLVVCDPGSYLQIAAYACNFSAVQSLVEKGWSSLTTSKERTPLHWLAMRGPEPSYTSFWAMGYTARGLLFADVVRKTAKMLVHGGVDVNAQDQYGRTALHYACHLNMVELIPVLVGLGADVTIYDEDGCQAVHYLGEGKLGYEYFYSGRETGFGTQEGPYTATMTKAAMDAFTLEQFNAGDKYGMTPLMHAVKAYNLERVKWLLGLGVDVSLKDDNGRTCLHHAMVRPVCYHVLKGPFNQPDRWPFVTVLLHDIKEVLLASGVDVTVKDSSGKTAADVLQHEETWIEIAKSLRLLELAAEREEYDGQGHHWRMRHLGRGRPKYYGSFAMRQDDWGLQSTETRYIQRYSMNG